jgi:hypothetical protein
LGPIGHSHRPRQRHCGTGIWPDRDIAAGCCGIETICASLPTQSPASRAHPRGKPGFSTYDSGLGRETDSPLERDGFEPSVPRRKRRGVLTADTRICWCGGAPSNGGMIFTTMPRRALREWCAEKHVCDQHAFETVGVVFLEDSRRALLAGAAFDYQNAREGMDRDRRQQRPRRAAAR